MRDRFTGVLGVARELEGLRSVEGDASSDFAARVAVGALERSLFGSLRLCCRVALLGCSIRDCIVGS